MNEKTPFEPEEQEKKPAGYAWNEIDDDSGETQAGPVIETTPMEPEEARPEPGPVPEGWREIKVKKPGEGDWNKAIQQPAETEETAGEDRNSPEIQ